MNPLYENYLKEVFHVSSIEAGTYTKPNKKWLQEKHTHTRQVLETGEMIFSREKELSDLSSNDRERFMNALLFHDFARVFEKDYEALDHRFFHGPEGAAFIKRQYDITDPLILISVMLHDQTNNDLIERDSNDLEANFTFQNLSPATQKLVTEMNVLYKNSKNHEKDLIQKAIGFTRDADTLGNLRYFETPLSVCRRPKTLPATSKAISRALKGEYVIYSDLNTFADQVLLFFAWVYHFNYLATFKILKEENILERLQEFLLNTLSDQPLNLLIDLKEDLISIRKNIDKKFSILPD